MTTKVKICGIRTIEAAKVAVSAGADFLGFNFVPSSRRFISTEKAKEIIEQFPRHVNMVGVFQDEKLKKIIEVVKKLKLDFVQMHSEKTKDYSTLTQYAGVIRSFNLPYKFEPYKVIEEIRKSDIDFALLDREKQGEGEMLELQKVREVTSQRKVFLAGGLTIDNVQTVIQMANPYAVDVAGGVETDGEQDLEKIKEFIQLVKSK